MKWQFVQHDLGNRRGGEIVEAMLSGGAANVRLMDSSNFRSYKSGRQHRYYGGLAKQSPVRMQIPHSGMFKWRRAFERGELSEPSMALIPVTAASPGDEIREAEEFASPAGGAIHIEFPSRAIISVESGADSALLRSILESLRKRSNFALARRTWLAASATDSLLSFG